MIRSWYATSPRKISQSMCQCSKESGGITYENTHNPCNYKYTLITHLLHNGFCTAGTGWGGWCLWRCGQVKLVNWKTATAKDAQIKDSHHTRGKISHSSHNKSTTPTETAVQLTVSQALHAVLLYSSTH